MRTAAGSGGAQGLRALKATARLHVRGVSDRRSGAPARGFVGDRRILTFLEDSLEGTSPVPRKAATAGAGNAAGGGRVLRN